MKNLSFTYAEIDLEAISHNIADIKKIILPPAKFMAVVKANAYGHGAPEVAKAALSAGADYLSVASLKEAIELKEAGVSAPILILSESKPEYAGEVVVEDLTQTVYTEKLGKELSEAARKQNKVARVHVKVDTGMGRIGVELSDALALIEKLKSFDNLMVEGIFTHFALAEDHASDYTRGQLERFNRILAQLKDKKINILIRHAANSAAMLNFPQAHFDMVRVGLCMYGIYPGTLSNHKLNLKPALSFKTRVSFVKTVPAGTALSYGCTHITGTETTIATLPVGYADGLSRRQSNIGEVLIRAKRFPIVGRVCMDLSLVDVGNEHIEIGDEAVIIGSQDNQTISANDVAAREGAISYEIVCGIGKRVPRIYK